jgi:hypothetical protein
LTRNKQCLPCTHKQSRSPAFCTLPVENCGGGNMVWDIPTHITPTSLTTPADQTIQSRRQDGGVGLPHSIQTSCQSRLEHTALITASMQMNTASLLQRSCS